MTTHIVARGERAWIEECPWHDECCRVAHLANTRVFRSRGDVGRQHAVKRLSSQWYRQR